MRALMWFRSDLRVRDNRALHAACRDADEGVIAVFTICPEQWRAHDWGLPKADFVLRNLAALSETLQGLNISLSLLQTPRFDEVPQELFRLAEQHGCAALYFNDEYEVNELERDQNTQRLFERHGLAVNRFCDQTILDVGTLRTTSRGFYSLFTPFKNPWSAAYRTQGAGEVLAAPPKRQKRILAGDFVPTELPAFEHGARRPDLWPAGEDEARKRLIRFLDQRIDHYDKMRDYPAADGTSALSPYLALGVISPRECFNAAAQANGGELDEGAPGITTWLTELIWREFYRHVLIGFPRVSKHRAFKPATERLPWRDDPKQLEAWRRGRTGVPMVDAGMRQMAQTGWMHNRVRMIVAMFFAKNLFLDWRRGEAFFMQSLVDADLASNNGGWQWSASTGTDAVPYFRVFNPFTQGAKFDPEGDYVRRYVPELARLDGKQIHVPPEERNWPRSVDYVAPIVDVKQSRAEAISAFSKL